MNDDALLAKARQQLGADVSRTAVDDVRLSGNGTPRLMVDAHDQKFGRETLVIDPKGGR